MHSYLRTAAAAANPIMLTILVVAAFFHLANLKATLKFLLFSVVAILVTFVLAHISRWEHLWNGHDGFPSGHMTLLACTCTLLILLDIRWIFAAVPLLCSYGWLLAHLHYHTRLDVLGAVLFTPPVTIACHALICHFRPVRTHQF